LRGDMRASERTIRPRRYIILSYTCKTLRLKLEIFISVTKETDHMNNKKQKLELTWIGKDEQHLDADLFMPLRRNI
jgi:hypothetical protein